ncbi:cupin domain-containing protein [Methanogenium sp. S4BF]|uniref:cupin domain-containing protein n=1 Tax=Methanogenium sp. S4BF TaxID=1789226 RepID=UPI002415BC3A|nr:cupin domain-containing protein [Methanogenium sp. S4BF]WFN33710.1 cupin domain-containing protein [Methanogenium sp. S4BF]
MILRHADDVPAEEIKKPGFSNIMARFLLTAADDSPQSALWLLEFGPGGSTNWHRHQEEQILYLLEGEGVVVGDDKTETPVRAGDVIYTLPCENHLFMNTGKGTLKMLGVVPILSGMTGKKTTACDE